MRIKWLLLLVFLLPACILAPGIETNPDVMVPTMPPAKAPPTPTDLSSTDSVNACIALISPEDGSEIPWTLDIITFSFTPVEGVERYFLNILTPPGKLVTFELDRTQADRFLSTFTMPGENIWYVEALNENREVLCTSERFKFNAVKLENGE